MLDSVTPFANWLEFAWQRYYKSQNTLDLPDVIAHADVNYCWPHYQNNLLSRFWAGSYLPGAVEIVDLPKDRLTVRPLARLSLEDRLIYEALVFSIAELIDGELPDNVYSYRWSKFKGDLRAPIGSWVKMQERGRALHEKYPAKLLAKTDITSFYEHIDIDVLLEDLTCLGVRMWTRKHLEFFLRSFQRMNHVGGIPQGPDASGVLANLYLLPVDTSLQRKGVEYLRYSDDLALFGSSWEELRQELISINRIMRGRRLSMSGAKTKVLLAHEVAEEFDNGDKDAIRYGVDIQSPLAGDLVRRLFDSATSEQPPNARDIRFTLNQMIRLDDDYAVEWVVQNFSQVPHLAPSIINYLESFYGKSKAEIAPPLESMLTFRSLKSYPYAEHHLLCFLLRRSIYSKSVYESAWNILSNRNEEGFLRETSARYIGRYARPGDGALLKQEFRNERSDPVRRALIVALYESQHFNGLWFDDAAESAPNLQWTCHYLKSGPVIPFPVIKR
ncbi:RNA-directed DNA polymerase [Microbispora sp. NPDC088329]|uniref:RNA-directed DNA polymerase n=1 Tax=Microbispora sp. NPDC088329 TaxID=3154869 RepID=UPI00344370C1